MPNSSAYEFGSGSFNFTSLNVKRAERHLLRFVDHLLSWDEFTCKYLVNDLEIASWYVCFLFLLQSADWWACPIEAELASLVWSKNSSRKPAPYLPDLYVREIKFFRFFQATLHLSLRSLRTCRKKQSQNRPTITFSVQVWSFKALEMKGFQRPRAYSPKWDSHPWNCTQFAVFAFFSKVGRI